MSSRRSSLSPPAKSPAKDEHEFSDLQTPFLEGDKGANTGSSDLQIPFLEGNKVAKFTQTIARRGLQPWATRYYVWSLALAFGQISLLVFGYAFMAKVAYLGQLPLPDNLAILAGNFQRETTVAVTIIATLMHAACSFMFKASVIYTLKRRMSSSVPLVVLNVAAKITTSTFMIVPRYLWWTVFTLVSMIPLTLLTAVWTTLLSPTTIVMSMTLQGTELDLGSSSFAQFLNQTIPWENDDPSAGIASIYPNSSHFIFIESAVSGISAAGSDFGIPGVVNFNGVAYNLSTGGVLPAVPGYTGSSSPPAGTGLMFVGGEVLTYLDTSPLNPFPGVSSRNFSIIQQGLSANVSCQEYNLDDGAVSLNNPWSTATASSSTHFILFNSSIDCYAEYNSSAEFVIQAGSSSDDVNVDDVGFLPSFVCPKSNSTAPNPNTFAVALSGFYRYAFIPPTLCVVTPFVRPVRVDYSGNMVNVSDVSNATPHLLGEDSPEVQGFIAGVIQEHVQSSQGLTINLIGDTLLSVYSSQAGYPGASNSSTNTDLSVLYPILENYLRGVVEFSATYLRSGFSAKGSDIGNSIPQKMTTSMAGTAQITTIGWSYKWPTYLFVAIPTAITTAMTIWALWTGRGRESPDTDPAFDPTNPLHIVMGSSAIPYDRKVRLEGRTFVLEGHSYASTDTFFA
ncbi:hypothetical protein BV22DRAFT_267228 [Leucogyrophana mollusca]|uniref:Uncharacterized protein n=1 Tax=Leucogyrophana mollusca TaxID=85980 RepID=A0ACB8BQZ3_9AGAM|nr:hypothetical protein BV22DRAFT_267228 [Leucogyrophana mollusca]